MKNLFVQTESVKNSLENRPLPLWMVDKLKIAPRRGEGCHSWIFGVACNLIPWRGAQGAFELIRSAITDPRVPDREILEAIKNASKRPDLWKPELNGSRLTKVSSPKTIRTFDFNTWIEKNCPFEITEEEVTAASPIHPMLEFSGLPHWKAAIAAAFRRSEYVVIQKFSDDLPPQVARPVSDWIKYEKPFGQFICANPVKSEVGILKKSANGKNYYSVRCLDNILERRYLVIEFDKISFSDQLKIHCWLSIKMPIVWLAHSGKRSIHGLYLGLGMSEEEVKKLYLFLADLGVDKNCVDASRLTRLPGVTRHDQDDSGKVSAIGEQKLLYLDPHISGASKIFHSGLKELALSKGVICRS